MAQLTLQDLLQTKTKAQLFEEFRTLLTAYGFKGTDFNTFSDNRAILEIETDALEDLWVVVQEIAKGMHLDTAEDGWLTLLAQSHYQIDRTPAEFTKGLLRINLLPGAGPYTINAGDLLVSDGNGLFYENTNTVPVNISSGSPEQSVEITAQTAGQSYNVATNTITTLNKGPVGITVTNAAKGLPATLAANYIAPPFNVNGQGLTILYEDGTNVTVGLLVYAANYATLAALVTATNTLLAASTLNGLVIAKQVTVGANNVFALETVKTGPSQKITLTAGTARPTIGYTTFLGASGYYENDSPALIYSAYQRGPFNVNGTTLILSFTEAGTTYGPQTHTFAANYATIADLAAAINASTSFSLSGVKYATFSDDGGRLKISSLKQGSGVSLTLGVGTSNVKLGLPTVSTTIAGASGWITREGRDEETDASLRLRCKSKWGILGAGTKDAFITWSKEASPKVQKLAVYSNLFNGAPKPSSVSIYIASLNGGLDISTVNTVYNYILPKLPIMTDLFVASATIVPVTYTGTIYIESAFNNDATKSAIRNNIQLYSQSLQIKEKVYKKKIERQILLVPGVVDVNLTLPVGDVSINLDSLGVIQESTVTPLNFIVV